MEDRLAIDNELNQTQDKQTKIKEFGKFADSFGIQTLPKGPPQSAFTQSIPAMLSPQITQGDHNFGPHRGNIPHGPNQSDAVFDVPSKGPMG
jgi:hypothetical protein